MSRNPDRCPTHPGELLREDVIPATGKPKAEIARMLGISRQHLYDILAERKPVSPEVAVRLAKLFGNAPLVWIRMQGAYDAWHAAREVDVSAVPTAAVDRVDVLLDGASALYGSDAVAGVVNTQEAAKARLEAFAKGTAAKVKPE